MKGLSWFCVRDSAGIRIPVRIRVSASVLALGLALAAGGCIHRYGSALPPDVVLAGDCAASAEAPRSFERPVVIALTEPVAAEDAPLPTNESERAVFSQLYETLVTLDCGGRVRPGLARSWSVSEDGREWTFRLRENARFSNGAPLLARNVRDAWEQMAARYVMNQQIPVPRNPWTWVSPESVRSVGDDTVIIALAESLGDPAVFANPALSVLKRSSHLGWPVGSGAFLLSMADRNAITLIPNRFLPEPEQARATLVFQVRPGADPRDVLAGKPDAVLVGTAAGLQYASRLPGYGRSLSGGERTYYLVTDHLSASALEPAVLTPFRQDLATDVVLADARPVSGNGIVRPAAEWVARPTRPSFGGEGDAALAYSKDDTDAGRIAERVTVWASRPGSGALNAEMSVTPKVFPLDALTFDRLLDSGLGWGFIVSLRSSDPLHSREEPVFFNALPWFLKPRPPLRAGDPDRHEPVPVAVPLVTTVVHLVLRDGLCGVVRDGTGTFSFAGAGWGEGAAEAPNGEGAAP